jgi:hypothetical protein
MYVSVGSEAWVGTVKSPIKAIFQKPEAADRAEAVARAYALGRLSAEAIRILREESPARGIGASRRLARIRTAFVRPMDGRAKAAPDILIFRLQTSSAILPTQRPILKLTVMNSLISSMLTVFVGVVSCVTQAETGEMVEWRVYIAKRKSPWPI